MQANEPPPYEPIITQIGRENKFSAEICILRTVGDAGPYNEYPYEKETNAGLFRTVFIYLILHTITRASSVGLV